MTREPVQIPDTFELRERAVSRVRPLLNRLGYRSLPDGADTSRAADHGRIDGVAAAGWGVRPEVVNLLQTFATQSALGDPERAAVPGDRG